MNWLKNTAWPWLKANWKWVLFPIGILMVLLSALSRMQGVVTIDPTAKADERAKVERERREREVAEERARLRARLDEVRRENQGKLQQLNDEQVEHAARLEDDPEALNEFLRRL